MEGRDERCVSELLQGKIEELEESRRKFIGCLSAKQRSELAKSQNTTQAVLTIIDSASFDWCKRSESGTGIAATLKKKFHQACKSLDQHAALFSVLPKESEYVSVFYGALNSIVAVSTNIHRRGLDVLTNDSGIRHAPNNGNRTPQDHGRTQRHRQRRC